jgi:hypothetical protein
VTRVVRGVVCGVVRGVVRGGACVVCVVCVVDVNKQGLGVPSSTV